MIALAILLFILWLMALVVFKVTGAFIHLLLVIAAVVFIYRLVTGRRPTGVP
jgi:hypothetical protein